MFEKTIPEGPKQPVEPKIVEPLVRAALERGLKDLESLVPRKRVSTVYRAIEHGLTTDDLEIPSYSRTFPEAGNAAQDSPEAVALTNYIWSRGQLKKVISGEDPDTFQTGWAHFTWSELILRTLWYLADRAATEDFALGRDHVPWRIEPADLEDAVSEVVGLLCDRDLILSAVCPIRSSGFPDDAGHFELEPGVTLESWNFTPAQAVFLTRFHELYMPDDMLLHAPSVAIRVRLALSAKVDAFEKVGAIVDRFRWAVMIARNTTVALSLGSVVLRSATKHVRAFIHHPEPPWVTSTVKPIGWMESRAFQGLHVDKAFLTRTKELLSSLDQASATIEELATAVWALGRSCSAQSPRDVLLEAAIGLERLLVSDGRGDLKYKFRLHGAAILMEEPTAFDDLGKIYDLRSKAAHGSAGKDSADFVAMAERARSLLARAIQSIAELVNSGTLTIPPSEPIGNGIASLVRHRVTTAVGPGIVAPR